LERYIGVKFKTRIEKGKIRNVSEFLKVDRTLARYINPKENEGNMSIRVRGGFLIKKSGARMTSLKKSDVVLVRKVKGNVVCAVGGIPSSESLMHYKIYKKRKDANLVLHFHDDLLLKKLDWPAVGPFPYGSKELANAVAKLSVKSNKIKIKGHGLVIIAGSREELVKILEEVG